MSAVLVLGGVEYTVSDSGEWDGPPGDVLRLLSLIARGSAVVELPRDQTALLCVREWLDGRGLPYEVKSDAGG